MTIEKEFDAAWDKAWADHELEHKRLQWHLSDTPKEIAIARLGSWLGTEGMKTVNDFWDESCSPTSLTVLDE